ncbi:MAG: hypothetical protein IJU79_04530 [Desulfovibrionaceae bacterium]|nr:hypothetical protein [Desulfovibrionaceae bacterium]
MLQELNEAYTPTGTVNITNSSIFQEYFVHEPHILAMPLSKPQVSEQKLRAAVAPKPVDQSEKQRINEALARAAEEALRANFAEAIANLSQPTLRNKAIRAIKKIAEQEDGIVPQHKHMFRDFSVSLRKKSLPEIALLFATRNVKLAPEDDHAHFNAARIYAILERFDDAIGELHTALDLEGEAADTAIYQKMLAYVERQKNRRLPPNLRNHR